MMIDMENDRTYVFVTINKISGVFKSTFTTTEPSVSVDDAIEFLQKYKDEQKDEQTVPLV